MGWVVSWWRKDIKFKGIWWTEGVVLGSGNECGSIQSAIFLTIFHHMELPEYLDIHCMAWAHFWPDFRVRRIFSFVGCHFLSHVEGRARSGQLIPFWWISGMSETSVYYCQALAELPADSTRPFFSLHLHKVSNRAFQIAMATRHLMWMENTNGKSGELNLQFSL